MGSGKAGYICVANPWPGRMLTVWGQDERFIDTYYKRFNKDSNSKDWRDWPFMCGDGAVEAEDGYYRILGRIDDVINVAGHRLGTKELESAGTFEDLTQLGSGEDDIDRQLKQLSSTSEVDSELEKMKAELGAGSGAKGQLGAGAQAAGGDSAGASQEQAQ